MNFRVGYTEAGVVAHAVRPAMMMTTDTPQALCGQGLSIVLHNFVFGTTMERTPAGRPKCTSCRHIAKNLGAE